MGALDGVGLRSTNVILTWAPSDQTFSKQGVVAPGSLQLPTPAAWTGEAAPKTSVNAATVVVAMRTRIEFTFDSFVFHKEPGQRRAPSCAGSRREPLPGSVRRDQITLVHCNRSAVKGGDGRGPK